MALPVSPDLLADNVNMAHKNGAISIATFQDIMMSTPDSIQIVDVRDAEKYSNGAISRSVNIPIDKLEQQLNTLPDNRPSVFICALKTRASEAYDMARLFRPDLQVYYLNASVKFSRDGSYQLSLDD